MRPRPVAVVGAIMSTLLLAACGSSVTSGGPVGAGSGAQNHATEVYDHFNALSGTQRSTELEKAAKDEGVLSVYTSNTDMDKLATAFTKKYGIKVNVYRANSETVLQRLLQEGQAGKTANDFLDTNAGELNVSNANGLLYPYKGELRDKVRKAGQAEGWTASRFNLFVVGWNTKLVSGADRPTALKDLTDPKWKGKISLEFSDVDWFAAMYQYYRSQGMSDDEVSTLFRKLASNAKVTKGHTVQGELLSAGQFSVAVSVYSHTIDKAAADGAPVSWRPTDRAPVQPVVIRPNGFALMKGAKHPAAALLFADWELTEGQQILAKATRVGSIPVAQDPVAGIQTVPVPEKELLDNAKKWNDLYAGILKGVKQVGGN
jgi:iron(III) transport system substrate-binding protein